MANSRRSAGLPKWGALALAGAVVVGGCGGAQLGGEQDALERGTAAEGAEIPESGYDDWPDDTVPVLTIELERPAEAAPAEAEAPPADGAEPPDRR